MLYECKTHGIWDADTASGCPECVRHMRSRITELQADYDHERIMRQQCEARIVELEKALAASSSLLARAMSGGDFDDELDAQTKANQSLMVR